MTTRDVPVVLDNVTKRFGTTAAVQSVSWAPRLGRVTALVGLNGAGKSTLMRVITGLVRPTEGRVSISAPQNGRALSAMIEAPALFGGLTARRNLRLHAALTGAGAGEVERVAELARVNEVLGRRVGALSQGYRQRLAIAVALLARPRILLLDEPTNALDPEAIQQLRGLIRQIADEGSAVIVSSHQLRELEGTADALTLIHEGRIRYDGPFGAFVGPPSLRVRATSEDSTRTLMSLLERDGIQGEINGPAIHIKQDGDGEGDQIAQRVFSAAAGADIRLTELSHVAPTLEEAFRTATTAGAQS
ncbi:ATP-binding cassette domain-containing protein [Actinomadura barringtoniae]|uniref:ATP-binding cassette domain-containing protein n=1 Tax=Actinomadura barringtoniae TaxID=1427535 RepID=A0A939PNA5_9ACTN|nr:ATP-binding cassette domain-containing protein [Actinomadura barringtoniae]MBO2453213.1 ATP-binding cassette domain-containing protein [Actinomadura barringtoniae]